MKNQMKTAMRYMLVGTSILLSGCGGLGDMMDGGDSDSAELKRDFTPEQILQPPRFQVGDRFRFDNQDMTWQVVNISDQTINWQSDTGEQQITTTNPLLPAIEWNSRARGKGKRLISNKTGQFFPLKAGQQVMFKTTVNTDKPPYAWEFDWNCAIAGEEKIQIALGTFDTFRVECSRQEPEKWIFYYAPRIGYYVKMEATGLKNGATSSRTLMGYVKNAVAYGDIQPVMAAVDPGQSPKIIEETLPPQTAMEPEEAKVPVADGDTKAVTGETAMPEKLPETAMKPISGDSQPVGGEAMAKPVISADSYLIHLASYKQRANLAQGEQNLLKKFPAMFSGLSFTSRRVDLGSKGIYYRLYAAGPTGSREEARALCARLKTRGQYCAVSKAP